MFKQNSAVPKRATVEHGNLLWKGMKMNAPNETNLTVAVCDTQPLIVEGLRALLENSARYRLTNSLSTLDELSHFTMSARPALVVVDKALGNSTLFEWLARVIPRGDAPVVIWGVSITDAE